MGGSPAQLGYGDGDEATALGFGPDDQNKYPTTYFRNTFNIADVTAFEDASFWLPRDDAAAVYLNGVEVYRDTNLPAGALFSDYGTAVGTENGETEFSVATALLQNGDNTIAVEINQAGGTSSDISFDLELSLGQDPSPTGGGSELIAIRADWKFMDEGSDQGMTWQDLFFDDSAWGEGPAELGYGDGDNNGPTTARR